jgi:hypothetical protein
MARQVARSSPAAALPEWIAPQLSQLVDAAPEGSEWLHEIKFDGYRMHAWLDRGNVRLLTRTGLDWTHKYPAIAAAVSSLGARQAYLDGELCGVFPDGITSFSMIQTASDAGNAAGLVFFIFDLLHLDGDDIGPRPLIERKARLAALLSGIAPPLHYSDYHRGQGPAFHEKRAKGLPAARKARSCGADGDFACRRDLVNRPLPNLSSGPPCVVLRAAISALVPDHGFPSARSGRARKSRSARIRSNRRRCLDGQRDGSD